MRQSIAILLCVAIALPGCASARLTQVHRTPTQSPAGAATTMSEYVQKLPAGSRIRLETIKGRTLRGTLMKATADEIVVQRNTRVPIPPEAIAMSDLARVTLEGQSSGGKLMAIGAAIGAGAAIGVTWLIIILTFAD
jgi:hypothetical protein